MTDKTAELLEAAKALLSYLAISTETKTLDQLLPPGETPAQRHRRKADEIEARDAAIKRFRAAVAALQE